MLIQMELFKILVHTTPIYLIPPIQQLQLETRSGSFHILIDFIDSSLLDKLSLQITFIDASQFALVVHGCELSFDLLVIIICKLRHLPGLAGDMIILFAILNLIDFGDVPDPLAILLPFVIPFVVNVFDV